MKDTGDLGVNRGIMTGIIEVVVNYIGSTVCFNSSTLFRNVKLLGGEFGQ